MKIGVYLIMKTVIKVMTVKTIVMLINKDNDK